MEFCSGTIEIWKFLGNILRIVLIIIPILIIFFGALDFGKAVVASKDDEIKKALKSLIFRIFSGLIILFIPYIIGFAFDLVSGFDSVESDYEICVNCLTDPSNCG